MSLFQRLVDAQLEKTAAKLSNATKRARAALRAPASGSAPPRVFAELDAKIDAAFPARPPVGPAVSLPASFRDATPEQRKAFLNYASNLGRAHDIGHKGGAVLGTLVTGGVLGAMHVAGKNAARRRKALALGLAGAGAGAGGLGYAAYRRK